MSTPRVALVTGSTSGIGIAIAQTLASAGFSVLVTGRSEERGAQVPAISVEPRTSFGVIFSRQVLPKWLS
jgi:NAD(P)-dependent dehydrogenase (short-subunit alcohol dehydrogenase family)